MAFQEVRTIGRIRLRLIWPLVALLFLNSLDRVNISFGALQMNRELGLDSESYGFGVSIFFIGYILFQAPSVWALKRCGARRWLFGIVGAWGAAATAMAFIRTPAEYFAVRTLLGFAEAGFAPGVIYLAATWMPVRYRANAVATVMLAVPLSLVAGGPICAWLMSVDNPLSIAGWRWMSLVEGASTIAAAFVCLAVFVDSPKQSGWLSDSEKGWLATELDREEAALALPGSKGLTRLAMDVRVWLSAITWFALTAGLYGVIFWLPQVVKQMAGGTPLEISLVTAIPWIACGVGTLVNARHSDRAQERYWHFTLAVVIGVAGLILAATIAEPAPALAGLALCGVGLGGAQGVFWTIPPMFLGRANATIGVPLINMVGNSSGIVAPYMVGLIHKQTGSFSIPLFALAGLLALGACAVQLVRGLSGRIKPPTVGSTLPAIPRGGDA